MSRVQRNDYVRMSDKPTTIDDYGIMRVPVTIARIGVQSYFEDGKEIRELRTVEEVEKSAPSFSKVPVTLDHPSVPVDSTNASVYSKGLTGDSIYEDGLIESDFTITHEDAVKAALSTHRQASCGYTCELDFTPGIWTDEFGVMGTVGEQYEYDAIQRDIQANHVALVQLARAGRIAAIHDSADYIIQQPTNVDQQSEVTTMVQIVHGKQVLNIDGDDAQAMYDAYHELSEKVDQYAKDLAHYKDKMEEFTAQMQAANARNDATQAALDAAKAKLEGMEEDAGCSNKNDSVDINAEVTARFDAWQELGDVIGGPVDGSLTVPQIRGEYLKKVAPQLAEKVDSGNPLVIDSMFEVLKPSSGITTDSSSELRKTMIQQKAVNYDTGDAIDKARNEAIKRRSFDRSNPYKNHA